MFLKDTGVKIIILARILFFLILIPGIALACKIIASEVPSAILLGAGTLVGSFVAAWVSALLLNGFGIIVADHERDPKPLYWRCSCGKENHTSRGVCAACGKARG